MSNPTPKKAKELHDNIDSFFESDITSSDLAVPADIAARLGEKGMEARWIDLKQLKENGGYHKRGWVPYQRKQGDKIENIDYRLGVDPDGYIRRANLVLAFRTKALGDKHRANLAERAKSQSAALHRKKIAKEIREQIKDAGIKSKDFEVDEEYE